jgi:hypothetical protein
VNEHEEAFINAFIRRDKRDRYRLLLPKAKRRREILNRLYNGADIDWSHASLIRRSLRNPSDAEKLLRKHGAGPTCFVIADDSELDGCEVPLGEALVHFAEHDWGAVLYCISGRLALYKLESPGDWFLLKRSAT